MFLTNFRVNTHKITDFYDKFDTLQNLSIYVIKVTNQNNIRVILAIAVDIELGNQYN